MHSDIIGDVFENKWLQMGDSLLEERSLKLYDALGNSIDGLLSLLDAFDEP
jgi:hypothetical protein